MDKELINVGVFSDRWSLQRMTVESRAMICDARGDRQVAQIFMLVVGQNGYLTGTVLRFGDLKYGREIDLAGQKKSFEEPANGVSVPFSFRDLSDEKRQLYVLLICEEQLRESWSEVKTALARSLKSVLSIGELSDEALPRIAALVGWPAFGLEKGRELWELLQDDFAVAELLIFTGDDPKASSEIMDAIYERDGWI